MNERAAYNMQTVPFGPYKVQVFENGTVRIVTETDYVVTILPQAVDKMFQLSFTARVSNG